MPARTMIAALFCNAVCLAGLMVAAGAAAEPDPQALEASFVPEIRPLVARYCRECHADERTEAEIDLSRFANWSEIRRQPRVWQQVEEMLESGQMPPKDARQPSEAERKKLLEWVRGYLAFEARSRAGDPGRVVLRRLNNAEYAYTLRDLTGVESLDPAREFPADGAAGEGFTNAGGALVMSPALVAKYLEAAKEVAAHAVLLPDGIRFSRHTTRSDWTNETLAGIREFYREFTDHTGGDKVNLQGIVFDTNQGGRLPLERYLAALLAERDALRGGRKQLAQVAREQGLSPKYLALVYRALEGEPAERPSLLLAELRERWRLAGPQDGPELAAGVARWQQALWRFTSVGHIGKVNGPKAWMEPVNPLAVRQDVRFKLPPSAAGQDLVLYLVAGDAGDGPAHDYVIWERPRLVAPGRPELLLRDVRPLLAELAVLRRELIESVSECLAAAAEALESENSDTAELAKKHGVRPESLAAWFDYLGVASSREAPLGTPITRKIESAAGYDFVKGWVGDEALSVVANSSDQHVRIPGNMKPHGVAVHPTPKLSVAVGWKSPAAATLRASGMVQHAHPECGNGVSWSLELRRGNTRQRLAAGDSRGAAEVPFGPIDKIQVKRGDVISLIINPKDGNHACDLTAIDLSLHDGAREWNLAREVSPNILAGNPHPDAHGNAAVWHFYSEPAVGAVGHVIPPGSLLARWQTARTAEERGKLAGDLKTLLREGPGERPQGSPDGALHQQLVSYGGPLLSAALQALTTAPKESRGAEDSPYGLAASTFGVHPKLESGALPAVDPASICVQAPKILEVRLPAELAAGAELVTSGALHGESGKEGSVQLWVQATRPEKPAGLTPAAVTETIAGGSWTSNNRGVAVAAPVLAAEGSAARRRFQAAFHDFRELFPAALCYTKIVPVDEVVTLTLFHREDHHLARLMLDEAQAARLNQLWNELHFISQDALTLVDAFVQLLEYASQDADPKVFEPMRKPIYDRAEAFRRRLVQAESRHLEALVEIANRAYRRPLTATETAELSALYTRLRAEEIAHDEAIRLVLARVFVAPAFLYRLERPVAGAAQGPVSDFELASRLSYFLWSSQPDQELLAFAAQGQLRDERTLLAQARRMIQDARARRLATEFACQWLHIYEFDQLDEKSERHFPTFGELRRAMYEESIQFFTDFFQNDRSLLAILDADYTFLSEPLARHYGIPWENGAPKNHAGARNVPAELGEWRLVEGVRKYSRGGILAQSATLAKQSGASRTSPILRGAWLSEVVLGEKLPRPPKDVPQLADTAPEGLTERQLIERHSSDAACAKCHARIDPLGFALEQFDAIGRYREKDAAGLSIDARAALVDGQKIDGLADLKSYLLSQRREAFVRQFCKKLLGYSLGRAVQLSDEPLLAEMQAELKAREYRVSAALEKIVLSRQFREIRGQDYAEQE